MGKIRKSVCVDPSTGLPAGVSTPLAAPGCEKCEECSAGMVPKKERIVIVEPCPECHGEGKLNWVDKILPKRRQQNELCKAECFHRNTRQLFDMLRKEYSKVGLMMSLEVENCYAEYQNTYTGAMEKKASKQIKVKITAQPQGGGGGGASGIEPVLANWYGSGGSHIIE